MIKDRKSPGGRNFRTMGTPTADSCLRTLIELNCEWNAEHIRLEHYIYKGSAPHFRGRCNFDKYHK